MFFESWYGLIRVLVVGAIAYAALLVILRTSGKRTLSKLNAFDLVVTVALGSTLASVLLSQDIALAEGLLALVLLILLQYLVAWTCVRFRFVRSVVKSEPTLLMHEGQFLDDHLRSERILRDEVLAAIRASGYARVEDVGAVVLETNGTLSVLPAPSNGTSTALAGVRGVDITRRPSESSGIASGDTRIL